MVTDFNGPLSSFVSGSLSSGISPLNTTGEVVEATLLSSLSFHLCDLCDAASARFRLFDNERLVFVAILKFAVMI